MRSEISKLVLGTDWMIAVPNFASWNIAPAKRAEAILNGAVEAGIHSFDTARIYRSEGVVGRFIQKHSLGRGAFRIISKGGRGSRFRRTPLTRKKLFQELDQSLRALGSDYLDVYLLHYDDPQIPAPAMAEWSLEILRSGKAHNIGYSNVSLPRLDEFCSHLREANVTPWVSNEFNALPANEGERWKGAQNISGNRAYVDYLRENNIPFLAYSPLGRGGLKKWIAGQSGENKPERRIDLLLSLSRKYGVPASVIALHYILQTAPQFHAVVGTRNLEHLKENVRALSFEMSEEDRNALAFPAGF